MSKTLLSPVQRRSVLLASALCALSPVLQAKTPAAMPQSIQVEGVTFDHRQFQLSDAKGKVVLLMFWSTDCAVCRDVMKELRENVQGWATQPFELVLVSEDARLGDVQAYNAILQKAVPLNQRFVQLWAKDGGYKDNLGAAARAKGSLPLAFVIDKTGKPIKRYQGRIPAQAWDDIADLL